MTHTLQPLLEIRNLRVEFPTRTGTLVAIDDLSLRINPGEVLGVVGESGAGKSMTGAAVIGLLESPGRIASGEILFEGRRIDQLDNDAMRGIRGRQIAAIFQDPLTSLNPLHTVGRQITDTIITHLKLTPKQARARALELLKEVGIPAAEQRINHYPHQFSGGMRQRVVITLALCADPKLIIADEPTTALDVSIQAQVIALLKKLCKQHGTAIMLITHDMGVIAEMADRVAVMYAGRIGEIGPVADVIHRPRLPYTVGLMGSIPAIGGEIARLAQIDGAMPRLNAIPVGCSFNPRCSEAFDMCRAERPELITIEKSQVACWLYKDGDLALPLARPGQDTATDLSVEFEPAPSPEQEKIAMVDVSGLKQHFDVSPPFLTRLLERTGRLSVKAVDGMDFAIIRGETFGLVGESGSGKSTVARAVVGLYKPTEGEVKPGPAGGLAGANQMEAEDFRQAMKMVFQDPHASLNPRWKVDKIIAESLPGGHNIEQRVAQLLEQVGLSANDARKYPHEFSGGQRQRISIARALAGEPEFLICDEPTSALDVSVQAQILNLMVDLQREFGLTYLFISHDLAVVHHISTQVGVMYLGRLIECADTKTLFEAPQHPYTRMLLDSVPDLDNIGATREPMAGEVPNPLHPPPGCAFNPRCPHASDRCRTHRPLSHNTGSTQVACHAVQENRLPAWHQAG